MSNISPAATVLVIKDHPVDGIQILLLKRNRKLKFAPDCWVFPGGRIDQTDGSLEVPDLERSARLAAVREAYEEASLTLDPDKLTHFCHWTTPSGGTRRFGTWFFHHPVLNKNANVSIDKSEIVDHIWIHPHEALHQLSAQKLNLLPPTFITLNRIKNATSYCDVETELGRTGVVKASPVTVMRNGLFYCLYQGDAGYNTADIHLTYPKHRLIIDQVNGKFKFEYLGCNNFPPVTGGVSF